MIAELKPVWKQFQETYQALRDSLGQAPEHRLEWRPGEKASSIAHIVQHVISANYGYVNMMEQVVREVAWEYHDHRGRGWLLERLNESEKTVRDAFEHLSAGDLNRTCAREWHPLNEQPPVEGPLDALWFALQIVRHTAYHLGQVNLYLLLLEDDPPESLRGV